MSSWLTFVFSGQSNKCCSPTRVDHQQQHQTTCKDSHNLTHTALCFSSPNLGFKSLHEADDEVKFRSRQSNEFPSVRKLRARAGAVGWSTELSGCGDALTPSRPFSAFYASLRNPFVRDVILLASRASQLEEWWPLWWSFFYSFLGSISFLL